MRLLNFLIFVFLLKPNKLKPSIMKKNYLLLVSIFVLGATQTNAQCSADFQFVTNGLTVNFQDSSIVSPNTFVTYDWNFGDNNVGFGTNPSHTYATAGSYRALLIISDSLFTCFDTISKVVTVTGGSNPTPCNLTTSYTINSNNSVSFSSSITGGTAPFAYSWDFGDNSMGSTTANPTHTYTNPGSYTVMLTVTDANSSTCTSVDSVFVNFCTANFSYQTGSNGTVSFTNQSNPLNAALINISWNFGDGNFSNAINPTHTYANSGSYIVVLNYFDSLSNCSATYSDSVNVQIGTPNSCNASFTKVKDSSVAFGVVLYNTSSNFGSHFYTWDFGDGITGSGRTPIHQYQSFGSYVVCLTITDSILNCTSTYCDTVGMDSLGNLKSGFVLRVQNPAIVGLTEANDLNSINLFPNPASDQISLDLTSVTSSVNISIMDVAGRIVRKQLNQNPGIVKDLELNNLQSGLYFMVLNNGASQEIKKFIKQ